jgi:hypothetical protein
MKIDDRTGKGVRSHSVSLSAAQTAPHSVKISNYSGSREEVQLLAGKSFGQPEKKLNFWLSSYNRQP